MEFFVKRKPKPTSNIMMNVYGPTGVGKSTLALTFPKPLYIINIDKPMDHLLIKLNDDEYFWEDVPPPVDSSQRAAQAIRDRFEKMVKEIIREVKEGTMIWDGMTPLMTIVNHAFVGKDADIMPKEYGERNSWIRGLLKEVAFSGVHFIMTNEQDEVWSGAKTKLAGVYESGGYAKQGHSLNIEAHAYVEKQLQGVRHGIQFDAFKFNTMYNGSTIWNPTFQKIHMLAFPDLYGQEGLAWMLKVQQGQTA